VRKSKGGRPPKDDKLMVEAMCYVLRTGVPWRDLPSDFGPWQSVYTRWRRWCRAGLWAWLFKKIAGRGFGRIRSMDTTCIKVHAHGANPAGGQKAQAMGRTKGGLNTKLAMIVDALGRPIAMRLAPGNRQDLKACEGLWHELRGGWLIADRAFDSDELRAALATHGIFACIPLKARRRKTYDFSKELYVHRHTVENANARVKRFRRISTRYEKLAETFLGFVLLAASLDWIISEV
jgi:transposase